MVLEGATTLLEPRPMPNFVETPFIRSIVERALTYIAAGFPVHFRWASGTGKTSLALHVASRVGRPLVRIPGDEDFPTCDEPMQDVRVKSSEGSVCIVFGCIRCEEDMTRR